jgi:uncharacterized protein YhfF
MIGAKTAAVEAFWKECREVADIDTTEYHALTFSDPTMSQVTEVISELARLGKKRGTAHLEIDFELTGVARRAVGDYWVILNSANDPLCLVRVTNIEVHPFEKVSAEFAASEGEGDLSRDYWATVHRRYFMKLCEKFGREWREDMPTVCESFELIHTIEKEEDAS